MCHHFDARSWDERTVEAEAAERDEESELPEFLDDEPATDVTLLTDGGDDD